ncbi:hypothetical protein ASE14_11945 [Agromyces sp. Root81]|uniref:hypothetical protein n=1 Tax=Agromyces sp. Root81 TaxID=1736601 RepID=UPI0006FA286B|nr:hypothetical protein [Agromyces sp. Root81]KRC61552.1 hypothetical protein ASE14_11945 [Agromyces sp. Root81]
MRATGTKGFLLFMGAGLVALAATFVISSAIPSNLDVVAATTDSEPGPWDVPSDACSDPSVKAEAEAARAAPTENHENSTLARPDEVAPRDRSAQADRWYSLTASDLALQHCLMSLGS